MTSGRRDIHSYSTNLEKDGMMLFEADEDDENVLKEKVAAQKKPPGRFLLLAVATRMN
jgi:hypothetical protein